MNKKLKLGLWILMGALLVTACGTPAVPVTSVQDSSPASIQSVVATPTPEPMPTVDPKVEAVMKAIKDLCARTRPGQVCYGQGPIEAEVQPGRLKFPFIKPGTGINLADLQRLKVGTPGSTEGIALLRILTENPGQYFTVIAFGDVELINEVPYGVQEFNGMQSMQLTTGANREGDIPTSGLLVQAPGDGKLSTLVINGVEMMFGSTAILTSAAGALTVHTLAGTVTVNTPGQMREVVQGTEEEIPLEPLVQPEGAELLEPLVQPEVPLEPLVQPEGAELLEPLVQPEGAELLTPLTNLLPEEPDAYAASLLEEVHNLIKQMLADREKQKNWKGGWWKETYGPKTYSGDCSEETKVVADGGGGAGPVEPFSREVPICRGNNGNTILMYDSGTSYDRIGPNVYGRSNVSQTDWYKTGDFITAGDLDTLWIISPTRMVLKNVRTSGKGCTSSELVYLDFVRDDPNVRCGKIIDLIPVLPNMKITPRPTPMVPTPAPFEDPPVEGQYSVRTGMPLEGCDAQAKAFAPDFQTANLSISAEKNLTLEAPSARYDLALADQPMRYFSQKTNEEGLRLGVYTLGQPLSDPFQLMMSMIEIPGQGFTGEWLVTNTDGSQMCGGSIDLLSQGEP